MENTSPFYSDIIAKLKSASNSADFTLEERSDRKHEQTLVVPKEQLVDAMEKLRADFGFNF